MTKRSKNSQSKHDAEVLRIARRLERQGFDVQADIKDYKKPPTFGGVRPDVVAKKGKQREIVEVETPESVDSARDQRQQAEFQKVANRSKNTTFTRKVTD